MLIPLCVKEETNRAMNDEFLNHND